MAQETRDMRGEQGDERGLEQGDERQLHTLFCVLFVQGADFIVVAARAVMFYVLRFRPLIRDKQAVGPDQDQIPPSQQPHPFQADQPSLFRMGSA
jgi:hypothetical protein